MLEEKLFEISPWKRDSHHGYVPVTLISFSDPMTPAAFAFDSMIISYLKDDEDTTIAVLSSRPRIHYDILLKKQGLDLQKLSSSKRINIQSLESMHAVPDDVNPESLEMLFGRVWEAVVQWIRDQLERNERKTVFFIDDLETLSIGSSTEKDCIEYLSNLRSTLLSAGSSAFIMGFDSIEDLGNSSTNRRVIEYCKASADMIISVSPLTSGYSNDVHGIIKVERGLDYKLIKYKAIDSGVKCSAFSK